jgi:two-component system CheB/CheR fusion protein
MPDLPEATRRAAKSPLSNPSVASRQADAASSTPPHAPGILPHLTVAIGASAGGLQAFSEFLDHLPADTGMAFVLIQHLDPTHKSLLADLLAPHTAMPVVEVTDGMKLAPNRVFVIPPDATMTIDAGRLVIATPAPERLYRWPIDACFASLAQDQNHHAVCIVLSGAGSDGARSLAAVKQHGGFVLAQARDDGQAMPGMPHSAVATGLVDQLLPASAMPASLLEHLRSLSEAAPPSDAADQGALDSVLLAEICGLLRRRTGHDFSQYKTPTLMRRIRHRMQARGIATIPDLVRLLRREPQEIERLFQDVLVGVTQFCRDPAAFDAVQQTVLPKLLAGKGAAESIRIWVPGCSSGEEVYSLAIMLRELMDRQSIVPKPQIFGTDIDEAAIAVARAGRYRLPALVRLTPERLAKWFVGDGDIHTPVREIREMCVFSAHSLIKDPPFSKLDLISCRNVLIYLGADLQARVIRNFHYALNPYGWLFLGPSEGIGHGTGLFDQVDRRHRLFQRRELKAGLPGPLQRDVVPTRPTHPTPDENPAAGFEDPLDRTARRALERYAPAYVVIDRACDIIRFSGGVVGRYLEPSPGAANLGLFGILRRPLRRPVRAAVHRAITMRETVVHEGLVLGFEPHPRLVTLLAQPISDGRTGRDRYLVAFIDAGPARGRGVKVPEVTGVTADDDRELARELAVARSQLLATIADLETANEELRSFNEEYQSANEELQATNEEQETAKEETQSVNEELQTINSELMAKNEQLTKVNNDFQNLMDSTRIATAFLDRDLRVARFTPAITALFALREADLGRPITEIASRVKYGGLADDVAKVLDRAGQDETNVVEREVQLTEGDATFLMRVQPYRTLEHRVDGVVITFVDISVGKRLQEEVERTLRALNTSLERRVVDGTTDLQTVNRALMQQTEWRQRAEEMLRHSQKMEAVGELTGGIAHDFNNLLGVIIGNVEFLLDAVQGQPELAELTHEVLDSALSGVELTHRLLAFARKLPLQPQVIDLNALVPGQAAMLGRTLGETIQVTTTLASGLWPTLADRTQIGEALLNLALNARDAMPHGGRLAIETGNAHLDSQDVAENTEIGEGDYVVLTVTDTGTGMPQEVIERAMEPFFTTKPPGIGSGLGLSMTYGFARQSGGDLRIESEVGIGTTVRLYLPRAPSDLASGKPAPDAELPDPGGTETILLVDDNPTLRAVTQRHLAVLGYHVSTSSSGPAALDMLQSGETFDLLFTDVVMAGGLSGYDLAEAARHLQPRLKLLFTTGYARDLSMDGDGVHDRRRMLRKPYRRRDLAKTVRAVLDGQ